MGLPDSGRIVHRGEVFVHDEVRSSRRRLARDRVAGPQPARIGAAVRRCQPARTAAADATDTQQPNEDTDMVRVVATFIAVWLAIGALGVLIQATIVPIPTTVVSLVGLAIAIAASALTYRRLHQ